MVKRVSFNKQFDRQQVTSFLTMSFQWMALRWIEGHSTCFCTLFMYVYTRHFIGSMDWTSSLHRLRNNPVSLHPAGSENQADKSLDLASIMNIHFSWFCELTCCDKNVVACHVPSSLQVSGCNRTATCAIGMRLIRILRNTRHCSQSGVH